MEVFIGLLVFGVAGLIIWGFFPLLNGFAKAISNPTPSMNYTPASSGN